MREVRIIRRTTLGKRGYRPGEMANVPDDLAEKLIRTGTAADPKAPADPVGNRKSGPPTERATLDRD